MKSGNLLTLTLGALLLAGIPISSAAVTTNSNIRLPTDAGAGDEWPSPPWECCDKLKQSPLRIWPPKYKCMDEVDHCAAACEDCKRVDGGYVCQDWYWGVNPGPKCTGGDGDGDGEGLEAVRSRPWKCCDDAVCTRSMPPTCSCQDKVRSCSGGCGKCVQVESQPPRFRCLDRYHGFPGPKCHNQPA
uniref:Bowman-Birk serine protease inhibitors family domain-containing protein n=1 Tax=Oryza meridionalis TaxID=40149 RepID=A0A0E0BWE9_9ORYZ